MRKYLLLLSSFIVLLCASGAKAQGTLYQINPPAPNAQVLVCPSPDNGYPCPSPVNIYSDVGLSALVTQPVNVGPGGFLTFYVAAGTYTIQLLGPGYNSSNRKLVTIGSGGGGSGTISPGTTNTLSKYTAATTLSNSLLSDNGTLLTYTGTGGISSTPTGGVGGTLTLPEGTAATASTGNDVCYGDSTAHSILCSFNNGAFAPLAPIEYYGACNNGTVASATTIGMAQFGANFSVAMCGTLQANTGVNPSHACTLKNLTAVSAAAGTSASDGIVTVRVAGSNTALTCTIGTGTSCSDSTHTAAVTSTQKIQVQLTSATSSTISNPGFAMQCQ